MSVYGVRVRRPLLMSQIKDAACETFGVSCAEFEGECRHAGVVDARAAFCVLGRQFTGASLLRLGQMIRQSDHTTVLHHIRNAETRAAKRPQFAAGLDRIRTAIEGQK